MNDSIRRGLSYDDVLLVPQHSSVDSRSNVDTSVELFEGITLENPVISSNMDTVTEEDMAQAMADAGGCGIIHRSMSIEEHTRMISNVDGIVGGCVGIDSQYVEYGKKIEDAGADFLCVDIANGHMERCVSAVNELSDTLSIPIMAGNVATGEGAKRLVSAGASSIKVGVGPGSVCKTRVVAGAGVPQFTAVQDVHSTVHKGTLELHNDSGSVTVIADGGIKESGDTAKALMAGADAVMCGSLFASCKESPGDVVDINGDKYKRIRGMASEKARKSNPDIPDSPDSQRAIEGVSGFTSYEGMVQNVLKSHMKGVRSGISYCGGHTIQEGRSNAEFVQVSPSTVNRNGSHGVLESTQD